MTTFDDRFAARVREVFEAHEEPVDEAALARLQASLAAPTPTPAADRAAVRRDAVRRRRGGLLVLALALVAGAVGVWVSLPSSTPSADLYGTERAGASPPQAAVATDAPAAPPTPAAPEAAELAPPGSEPAAPAAASERVAEAPPPAPAPSPEPDAEAAVLPEAAAPTEAVSPPVAAVPPVPTQPAAGALARLGAAPPAALALAPSPERRPDVAARPIRLGAVAPASEGVRLVVSTGTVASGGGLGDGAGVAAGVAREWALTRGVALSGEAVLAYGRTVTDPDGPSAEALFDAIESDPARAVEVPSRSVLTTVAVEVPVDVTLDVVRTRRGRLRASVGLTSALYVDQTFEDEGARYSGEYVDTAGLGSRFVVSAQSYDERETAAGHLDLGRQLNLGLGVVGARPGAPGVDVYARLPLGEMTSRDVSLTVLGVRLRLPLP